MIRLHIIVGSVRPVRVGLPVGLWMDSVARGDERFDVTLVDLAEVNLPFLDEPEMPHLGKYTHEHTKAWSRTIDSADAFVLVMPEYNGGVSPALKNALDFLSAEWKHKAVGLVSYGGISAGQRGAQVLKPTLLQLGLMPVPAAVPIPFVSGMFNEAGDFEPTEAVATGAGRMLDSISEWTTVLEPLRRSQGA
ncbi:MAG: NAD(P)H-dependent oxidoreductase [Solirubrobacterales bacterium]